MKRPNKHSHRTLILFHYFYHNCQLEIIRVKFRAVNPPYTTGAGGNPSYKIFYAQTHLSKNKHADNKRVSISLQLQSNNADQ